MQVQKTKWVERTFNFDFPVGMFPLIMERLRGTPARIEEMIILAASGAEKNLELRVNKWSIKEHIGHLTDLEELHEGRIEDFKNGLKTLRPADMTNKKTNEASHNSVPIEKLIFAFRNSRSNLINHLENKNEKELSATAIHPRLNKPMRLVDMAFFVAEHDNHHLAGIREIIVSFEK